MSDNLEHKHTFKPVAIECDEPQGLVQIKIPEEKKYGTEPRIDIRRTYIDKSTGEMRFTKNGLNLPADKTLAWLDTVLEAYNQAYGHELVIVHSCDVKNQ